MGWLVIELWSLSFWIGRTIPWTFSRSGIGRTLTTARKKPPCLSHSDTSGFWSQAHRVKHDICDSSYLGSWFFLILDFYSSSSPGTPRSMPISCQISFPAPRKHELWSPNELCRCCPLCSRLHHHIYSYYYYYCCSLPCTRLALHHFLPKGNSVHRNQKFLLSPFHNIVLELVYIELGEGSSDLKHKVRKPRQALHETWDKFPIAKCFMLYPDVRTVSVRMNYKTLYMRLIQSDSSKINKSISMI